MNIRVLGSAAGGGFPQWNCNCPNCRGLRDGTLDAKARTQSSIAVSADGTDWVLINASPDLLAQIKAFPALQPNRALRDTGIKAIILVDGQIDHTTGLLMLREGKPLQIWCTDMVREDLTTGNPLFNILGHYCSVDWRRLPIERDTSFSIDGIDDVTFAAVPLASKAPPYSPHRNDPHEGDNVGLRITDTRSGRSVFYAPGLGEIEPRVATELLAADALMVDGTF
jgi:pyrroloquinoline quinone biosynthesis protein B